MRLPKEALDAIQTAQAEGRVTYGPSAVLDDPASTGEVRNKYGNVPCEVDGEKFQSTKEARRWGELRLMEKNGLISDLKRQVPFSLHAPNMVKVATYYADMTYIENGELVVEDVKSPPTRKKETYRIKKRWMKAEYGIEIMEI